MFFPLRVASERVNQKVDVIGIVIETGFPKPTMGTGKP